MRILRLLLSGLLAATVPGSAQAASAVLAQKNIKVLPTKDVVIVAWINENLIAFPSILNGDPIDPVLIGTLATPGLCTELVGEWALGFRTLVNTDADRRYANAFLIANSANAEPPVTGFDANAVRAAGDYRVFARFKVAYRVKDGKVIGEPVYKEAVADIGWTPDPCGVFNPLPPEAHTTYNGHKGITVSQTGVYLLAEGRVGTGGQAVDRTLNDFGGAVGNTTPWIWGALKFDTQGNLVFPFPIDGRASFQIFPTYYVYQDGQLIRQLPQGALEPFISLNSDSIIIPPLP